VFFSATRPGTARELWRTNGTTAGTRLVRDINPKGGRSVPDDFTVVGDTLFFAAQDPATTRELWMSDGTRVGTQLVKDIVPGRDHDWPWPTSRERCSS
jgi:ELWxxDGT repeat protein